MPRYRAKRYGFMRIRQASDERVGMLRPDAERCEAIGGEILQVLRHDQVRPPVMAAARTCLSSGSGSWSVPMSGS